MPQTAFQSLGFYSEQQLRVFAELLRLPGEDAIPPSTLRDEVNNALHDAQALMRLFEELEPLDQHYVREILHGDRLLNLEAFEVRYGGRPAIYRRGNRYLCALRLFADRNEIHRDLRELLLTFVPPPDVVPLLTLAEAPKATVRLNESDALNDVLVLLNAMATGQLTVSSKTGSLGTAATREIAALIRRGDLYPPTKSEPIRSFAWTTFLEISGYKLVEKGEAKLNAAGELAIVSSPAPILREIWYRWIKQNSCDEFKRLDGLKIEKTIARRNIDRDWRWRRLAVEKALAKCPVGEWVAVDDFFKFIRSNGMHFELTSAEHGMLIFGKAIEDPDERITTFWDQIYGRYILCFLMEYAATLGIIDIAYVDPVGARADCAVWAQDGLSLSRYDGLIAFRLTQLGAFILGMVDSYESPNTVAQLKMTVMSGLTLSFDSAPPAEQSIILDLFADRESDTTWRLSKKRALMATQRGFPVRLLRDFIERFDDQPLPETVDAFLEITERNSQALRSEEAAILIQCANEDVATKIAQHQLTAKFTLRAGSNQLVVRKKNEDAFRKAVNTLGYGFAIEG